ncbi:MAG TPA: 50S ribosomal protein L40e [archaeon]|nr:50S ribosomal protein L40e [archaeon]
MADIPEAIARRFTNVYICQTCNATNRCGSGKPRKCRKCGGQRFRLKKKKRKASASA